MLICSSSDNRGDGEGTEEGGDGGDGDDDGGTHFKFTKDFVFQVTTCVCLCGGSTNKCAAEYPALQNTPCGY